jgi:hypothetical protein
MYGRYAAANVRSNADHMHPYAIEEKLLSQFLRFDIVAL